MKRLLAVILLTATGCAAVPPPTLPNYVCVPAMTPSGQHVLYCQPHLETQ